MGEMGGVSEVAAILEASLSGGIQPDPSHSGSNRNEWLVLFYFFFFLVSVKVWCSKLDINLFLSVFACHKCSTSTKLYLQ